MSFLSLYRKYRPRDFEDLVGQKQVVQTLKNALENNRIAHAYLFAGPRGTGKTSTAKVFAQALNCVNGPTAEPCNQCDACQKIQSGQSIDVIEIDAASNRGIDEIRDLREKVKFYPSEGKYKVYIIDEVHMLTKGAFNALLKTLEEPPENVVFILATTEPHKVINTILSRCQRFDFSLLTLNEIKERLKLICQQEAVDYEEEALDLIARSSSGGMRDAISILDQAISFTNANLTLADIQQMLGRVDEEVLNSFFQYIISGDSSGAIKLVNKLIDRGNGVSRFVSDLIEYFRQLLLIKECGVKSGIIDLPEQRLLELKEESDSADSATLIRVIEVLTTIEGDIRYREQPRLILEMGIMKMVLPGKGGSSDELETRISKLEEKMREIEKLKYYAKKYREKNDRNQNKSENNKAEEKQVDQEKVKNEHTPSEGEVVREKTTSGEELSIDQIRDSWPAVLDIIKEENIRVQAFLVEGTPFKVEGDTIWIKFPEDKGFHKRGAENEGSLIRKAFTGVLSRPCQLKFIIDGNNSFKKKDNIVDQQEEELVDKIVKLFDGEIIKADNNVLNE